MRVTPLDIRKQEFRKVMRGLDTDEVYAFLQTVADEYEAVLSDNKNLRERMVELEDRLKEYRSMETNLRNTLLTAEKITAEAKENAKREASLIVREAEVEAEKAAETIRAHTMQLRREILELKKQKDNYITRLKTLLDSHRKVLEGFEEDFSEVDRAIERIGDQVEMDIKQPAKPPRMSRRKITEDVVAAPEDKVIWDDERKREEEPRPSMPRPEWQGQRKRESDAAAPEDIVGAAQRREARPSHAAPGARGPRDEIRRDQAQRGGGFYDGEARRIVEQGVAGRMRPGAPVAAGVAQRGAEPRGAEPVVAEEPPQAVASEESAQVELKRTQDDWKHYEVRDKKTDWTRYDVPRSPTRGEAQAAPPSDSEVEEALSGLNEMRRGDVDRPGIEPHAGAPHDEAPPAPAEETPLRSPEGDKGPNGFWNMDQLRKNLSNFIGREGEGEEKGEI